MSEKLEKVQKKELILDLEIVKRTKSPNYLIEISTKSTYRKSLFFRPWVKIQGTKNFSFQILFFHLRNRETVIGFFALLTD